MEYLLGIAVALAALQFAAVVNLTARVARLEWRLSQLLRHHGLDPSASPALSDRAKQLAADPGRKVEAIRAVRDETGASLAEAKKAVEEYARSHQH